MDAVDSQVGPWRGWLDEAIRREILRLRARYELSLDEYRGLYISDEQVERLLAAHETLDEQGCAPPDSDDRLGGVGRAFGLDTGETAALFVALAPEIDAKYVALYAYLNDDVTRKWLTVDIVQRLTGLAAGRLQPDSRLFALGLLRGIDPGGPTAWRLYGVVVAAAVRSYLMNVAPVVPEDVEPPPDLRPVVAAIRAGRLDNVVIDVSRGGDPESLARSLAPAAGRPLFVAEPMGDHEDDTHLDQLLLRARLHGGGVYFPPGSPADTHARVRRALTAPVLTIFALREPGPWRSVLEGFDYETVACRPPGVTERGQIWSRSLADAGLASPPEAVAMTAGLFSLHARQIEQAAGWLQRRHGSGAEAGAGELAEAARGQCATTLDDLATRLDSGLGWDDLVVPPATRRRLEEFVAAVRGRHVIFTEWAFARHSRGTSSVRGLFSGASGTGKTVAATVVAADLGLPLYRIDLSAVVSKYIGETEKNLEQIFRAAEGSNALLFFDEADALFGKRSEVKDAHDRYANIEVAYLLQRMETYDGVMVLATNLAANIDDAFTRRLHFDVEFPLPGVPERERLWRLHLPAEAPVAADVDYAFLARQFPLAGGDIRNAALDAAFLATYESTSIGMPQLVRAVGRQRQKQGRLPSQSEFQQYFSLVKSDGADHGRGRE